MHVHNEHIATYITACTVNSEYNIANIIADLRRETPQWIPSWQCLRSAVECSSYNRPVTHQPPIHTRTPIFDLEVKIIYDG